jgi:hypothetical protein
LLSIRAARIDAYSITSFSATGNDANDLKAISVRNFAAGEFGRSDGIAIVLHHDAAGEKILRAEKFFKEARKFGCHTRAIGDDGSRRHLK